MKSPSKFLFYAAVALILFSVAQTYWKIMVIEDFAIVNDVETNEEVEDLMPIADENPEAAETNENI